MRVSAEASDAAAALARHVIATPASEVPGSAVAAARLFILDTLAATIAGSAQEGIAPTVQTLSGWAGRPESRVAFYGVRLPVAEAVIANVAMAHALEIDDAHYPAIVHPTAPTLWTALGIADTKRISGRDLVASVAIAVDMMVRIGLSCPRVLYHGYHTALISGFGAAAVAGRLTGSTVEQLHHALGITFSQAGATVQAAKDGAIAKRLQPGFNAADGIRAVALAARGITGIRNVLEGEYGFARLFNHGPVDREALFGGLGQRYLGTQLTIKRYPTSRCAHGPVEATLAIAKEHALDWRRVRRVSVSVSEGCFNVAGAPFDESCMVSQTKAQFCIPYTVAAALRWGEMFVDQVQPDALRNAEVAALAEKVAVVIDPALTGEMTFTPVEVAIELDTGEVLRDRIDRLKGSPEYQLTWDEVVEERVKRAVRHSAVPLSAADIDTLVSCVAGLEELDDASRLTSLLTPGSAAVPPASSVRRSAIGREPSDPIVPMADHVRKIRDEDIPEAAREATRRAILECLATTIAGSVAPGCAELVDEIVFLGGREDARIVFSGRKVPAHYAAQANITLCHAPELDDLRDEHVAHATTPSLWSALAQADRAGRCSGRELVTAVAIAADVTCRIAAAAPRSFVLGHHHSLIAGFAAVSAAGRLAGASTEELLNAYGLAMSQAAASVQALRDDALVKRLQPGFNAADGLRSLDLARAGVTGVRQVLGGQFGFSHLFGHAACDEHALLDRLGSRFLGAESGIRRHPGSRGTHAPIDPPTWDELCSERLRRCCEQVDAGTNESAMRELMDTVRRLDDLADARDLIGLLEAVRIRV